MSMSNIDRIAEKISDFDSHDIKNFLFAFLTPSEIKELETRYSIVEKLVAGELQSKIAKDVGVSTEKVSRGAREYKYGIGRAIFRKCFGFENAEEEMRQHQREQLAANMDIADAAMKNMGIAIGDITPSPDFEKQMIDNTFTESLQHINAKKEVGSGSRRHDPFSFLDPEQNPVADIVIETRAEMIEKLNIMMGGHPSGMLNRILEHKKQEISSLYYTEDDYDKACSMKNGNFLKELKKSKFTIIPELKKQSPSGHSSIHSTENILAEYRKAGIKVISVLTDSKYFDGSIEDVSLAKKDFFVLRKDFIISHDQIIEAKLAGCSAILLIVKAFRGCGMLCHDLHTFAVEELGLDVLVEVENETELLIARSMDAKIIGVNARNLETLEIDQSKFQTLFPKVPNDVYKIALSGMRSVDDIRQIKGLCDAVLVGSSITSLPLEEIPKKIREFQLAYEA